MNIDQGEGFTLLCTISIFLIFNVLFKFIEQDILNSYFHFNPDLLYVIPCDWNYRSSHCSQVFHIDQWINFGIKKLYTLVSLHIKWDNCIKFLIHPTKINSWLNFLHHLSIDWWPFIDKNKNIHFRYSFVNISLNLSTLLI